jgi:hypothetical protein
MALTFDKIRQAVEKNDLSREIHKTMDKFAKHRNQSVSYSAHRCLLALKATTIDDDGRLPAPSPVGTSSKSKVYHDYISAMADLVRIWWAYQKNFSVYIEVMEKIKNLERLYEKYENN